MPYLHIGQSVTVEDKRIIGIFDLDNTTYAKHTRNFLDARRRRDRSSPCARISPAPSCCATTPIIGRSSISPNSIRQRCKSAPRVGKRSWNKTRHA